MKYIDISTKKHPNTFALVDDSDFCRLNQYKWHMLKVRNSNYVSRKNKINGIWVNVFMHREILSPPKGVMIDHVDGNGLNNQKKNMRLCSHSQNMQNRRKHKLTYSKYKGVVWNKKLNKWQSRILHENKRIHIGTFQNEIDAAKAYDKKSKELCGEFACLNFIDTAT
jgi:hypothetical protein